MILLFILFSAVLAKYSDNDINALEDFIWSQNKSESLQSFAPNSEVKLYLEGNLLLQENKGSSNRFKNILDKLKNDSIELYWRLYYRSMVNKLEIGDAKTKKKMMENFKENLYPNIDLNEQPYQSSKALETINGRSVVSDSDLFVDMSNIDTNLDSYRIVRNAGKWNLNVEKMSFEVFQEFLYDPEAFEFDGVEKKIGEYFSSGLISQTWIFPQMTVDQLEYLFKNYPVIANNFDFLIFYFPKKYKFGDIGDENLLYKAFAEAWTEIKDLPENYYIKSIMLYNLLCAGISIKEYDEAMLLEYMNYHRYSDIYKDNNKGYSRWVSPNENLSFYNISENELLQAYFNQLFKDRDSTFPYEKFITKDSLNEFFALAKIFNGNDPLNYEKNISKQTMKNLLESSELELCKVNPKKFNANDEVKLCLSMRNIQNLIVSIYEINTKAYYAKKEAELTADIEIEGFIASEEYSYTYKAFPFLKREEEFSFPTLTAKRGTFIIDFIGNGRQSRAMITKGNLKYIIKPSEPGQQLFIFDEDNKVCTKQTCGIILDGKFYQVSSNGVCQIPFAEEDSNKNLIITDGEISLLVKDFQHLSRHYELKSVFLLYEEQFLYSQNATIQIKPSLYMNSFELPLSLLAEFEITLQITSIDQKINSKIFKASPSNGLISINFQVPYKVTRINISAKSSIGSDSNVQLENNYSISLNSYQYLLSRPYLRKTKGQGFAMELRGRNGELYKGQKVTIDFHIFETSNSATYFSDNDGKIYLGELDGVHLISVNYNDGYFEWSLEDFKEKIAYPEKINIKEGENIELDFYQAPLITIRSYKKNTLFKMYRNQLEKDFTDYIKYGNGKLKILGLSKGIYVLKLRTMNAAIRIEVSEGFALKEFNYLMLDSKSLPHKSQESSISIENIKRENGKLIIDFSDNSENGSAYILLCNYLSGTVMSIFNALNSNSQKQSEFIYEENKISYLKSRRINEEFRYAIDRKKQPKYQSINLPKPQLALKRQKIKDTDTEVQEVDIGEGFIMRMVEEDNPEILLLGDDRLDQAYLLSGSGGLELYSSAYFLDFLEAPSIWSHLTIPVNHQLSIGLEEGYSQVIIFAYKNGISTMKIYPIDLEMVKIKPIILDPEINDNDLRSEQIKNSSVSSGETLILQSQDITSIEILDSIESLQNMQIKLLDDSNEYKEWLFLSTWSKISNDKKNYYFDRYFSHELNLFLYFKDQAYFNAVVKPFISNKMEKDIIDKYLLGESLSEYIKSYWKLNCLEKILLIDWGIKQGDKTIIKEAKDIAQDLINKVEPMSIDEEKDYELLLKIFQLPQEEQNMIDFQNIVDAVNLKFLNYKTRGGLADFTMNDDFTSGSLRISNIYKPIKKNTIERTKEYKETYYFSEKESKESLQPNRFWKELAQSILLQKKILTPNAIFSLSGLTELISVLAFMDLPILSSPLSYFSNGSTISIASDHNFLAFYKDLSKTPINLDPEILVSQKFINPKNPNSQVKQFLTKTRYESKIIVTNASDMNKFVYVLLQVPGGSIPISDSFYIKTECKTIGSYQTEIFSYQFYFPEEGNFTIHPVVVTRNQKLIGNTEVKKAEVLGSIKNISADNIEDFAINGNEDDIMKYLRENNLYSSERLARNIYHRMKNCSFYTKAIAIFKEKKYFDEHLYLYSMLHEDYPTFYELLRRNEDFVQKIGYNFESSIIKTGKEDFTHYEYFPLINARAHNLGARKAITNLQFKETYYNFLMFIAEKNKLDIIDYICLCQYYILQDRYTEALNFYDKLKELGMKVSEISPSHGLLQIQFDYLSAFLYSSIAKELSSLYANYPVETWRNNFMEIYQSLSDSKIEDESQEEISREPALSFTIENNNLSLTYQNVKKCEVKIYYIDLEILFSKNPFFIQDPSNFVFLAPNLQFSYDLPEVSTTIQLPNDVKRKSFVVEIDYGEYSSIKTAFNAALKTMIIERYGHIKVMSEDNNPRSTTYVKVFAKLASGEIEFYKDGYTDKRGAFDFISMNYDKLSSVDKFAILVVDEELGSLIVEASPPKTFTKDL
ncbi:unnamed protein product [Blepharisma stoltei]|uniref:Alpha-2-macroglobulin domain-containing protein n=1 Tax=Blepharisma stoltei TaxID=1481888 RepID=A0AAU9JDP1_9CILI|nr:unnamed protein product [Blepharisma stoltei]